MPIPDMRLFSVNVGALDEGGIPDPRLRARTDQVATATLTLLLAAGLTGRLAITHTVRNGTWLANIDAESEIFEKLELFQQARSDPLGAQEAAGRVTDHAAQEIRKFMAVQQPVNLATLQHVARRAQTADGTENPVVSTLRREPGQTMTLTTRTGTLTLTLQGVRGAALAGETRPVVCQIEKLGPDTAILKLPKGERQGIPLSAGRLPRLAIPPSLARSDVLAQVFSTNVLTRAVVLLRARDISDRRTGRVTGLQLEEWPRDSSE